MERLDLAADERRNLRQLGDRGDLDAIACEVLTRAVGGVDLDAERDEIAGQPRDALAVGDRQQGSHPGFLHPHTIALNVRPSIAPGMAYSDRIRPGRIVAQARETGPRRRPRPAARHCVSEDRL